MLSLYLITNLVNHKFYIGVTSEPDRRLTEHKCGQGSIALQRAFKKYGEDQFKFEVLFRGKDSVILQIESELVCQEILDSGWCYNMVVGGGKPPLATPESSAKSAATRKRLIAEGKIKPPPRLTPEAQARKGKIISKLMSEGKIPKPPRPSSESQTRGGETRKRLHALGLIDIGPGRDEKIYKWQHKDGRIVELRRCDMELQYGLPSGNITNLLKGRAKTCLGWRILNG
ncbi:GIY-YIG nuclease family protein [Escherichia coli]|uniref:GIY-YIG nuclease family protein n=1 Tax=Escherichia coli TaxID=562 RepID=UPI001F5A7AF9|nr:GIY-YIG nuclease family protein [Escherichia coli]MCI2234648.1 GIY-YIG nuclease family protein [Escherichia coli]